MVSPVSAITLTVNKNRNKRPRPRTHARPAFCFRFCASVDSSSTAFRWLSVDPHFAPHTHHRTRLTEKVQHSVVLARFEERTLKTYIPPGTYFRVGKPGVKKKTSPACLCQLLHPRTNSGLQQYLPHLLAANNECDIERKTGGCSSVQPSLPCCRGLATHEKNKHGRSKAPKFHPSVANECQAPTTLPPSPLLAKSNTPCPRLHTNFIATPTAEN